jgi:hypothetical protein
MYVTAGQREKGQLAPAQDTLSGAFATQSVVDIKAQREKFMKLVNITRRFSDNFLPDKFESRNNANLPDGCLDKIMEGNIKALAQLHECLDEIVSSGVFPKAKIKLYRHIVMSEDIRLKNATPFFAQWKQSQGISSQPEHNAV